MSVRVGGWHKPSCDTWTLNTASRPSSRLQGRSTVTNQHTFSVTSPDALTLRLRSRRNGLSHTSFIFIQILLLLFWAQWLQFEMPQLISHCYTLHRGTTTPNTWDTVTPYTWDIVTPYTVAPVHLTAGIPLNPTSWHRYTLHRDTVTPYS